MAEIKAPKVGQVIQAKNDDGVWLTRRVRAVRSDGWFFTQSGRGYRIDQFGKAWRFPL